MVLHSRMKSAAIIFSLAYAHAWLAGFLFEAQRAELATVATILGVTLAIISVVIAATKASTF